MRITIPPKKNIEKFESIAASFDMEIFNRDEESRTLAALRDTLLPKLMRGEIGVENVAT